MTYYFNEYFIKDNEVIFYIYLIVMLIIMLLTLIFVIKELSKK